MIRHSIAFIWIFFGFLGLIPSTTFANAATAAVTPSVVESCNLPAPTGIQTTNIGTNFVSLAWNTVAGATGYSVDVFLVSNGSFVTNQQTTTANITINGLAPNTNYQFRVQSICSDGSISTLFGSINASTIIVELVANGSPNNSNSFENLQNSCYAYPANPQNKYWIHIYPTSGSGKFSRFSIDRTNPLKPQIGKIHQGLFDAEIYHCCEYENQNLPPFSPSIPGEFCQTVSMLLQTKLPNNSGEVPICHVDFTTSDFCVSYIGNAASSFDIKIISQQASTPRSSTTPEPEYITWPDDRLTTPVTLVATPNPAFNELNLDLSDFPDDQYQVSIIDASGRPVLNQMVNNDKNILNIERLSPGIYFLHVNGAQIQPGKKTFIKL